MNSAGLCIFRQIADNSRRLAAARLHSDMRCCLNELHILLSFHRQHSWFSPRRNFAAHCSALLPSLPILHLELVAFRTLRRALLPHRRCMCHLSCRADHLNVDVSHSTPLFRHVPSGHGVILGISTHPTLGFRDSRATKSQASCYACFGNSCIEYNKHRHCLSLSSLERTVRNMISRRLT